MKKLILLFTVLLLISNIVNSQDNWEIINTPPDIDIYSLEVDSTGIIYIGLFYSSGGGILRSDDDGCNWLSSGLQNMGISSITIANAIFAGSGNIYSSANYGVSWETVSPVLDPITLFVSNNDNLFTGVWGGIYKCDTIGANWEQVLTLENTEVIYTIIEDTISSKLYAGATNFISGGGVYCSQNGGDTWEHIGLMDHYVSSLAMNLTGDLFAGTRGHYSLNEGGVYILPNGQTEWINLNNEELVTSMVINSEDNIYIGCSYLDYHGGGVRYSVDNGQTWEDISLETMYDRDIEGLILGPQEHLYAFEHNSPTPLYKSVDPTITFLPENEIEKCIKTFNYPNPFSEETTIYFELPLTNPIEVQIAIYNSQGNKIQDIILPKYFGKGQSIKWNSKGLPAGLYYYKLSAGSIRTFKKMVLQK